MQTYTTLFPTIARPLADDPTLHQIRLHGMVYQLLDREFSIEMKEGASPRYIGYSLLDPGSALFRALTDEWQNARDKCQAFLALKPASGPHLIRLSALPESEIPQDYKFGVHKVIKHQRPGLDLTVEFDDNGYFQIDVPLQVVDGSTLKYENGRMIVGQQLLQERDNAQADLLWLQVSNHVSSSRRSYFFETSFPVTVFNLKKEQIHIVSDVDDTIKISNVGHGAKEMVSKALVEGYKSVPGMSELMKVIAKNVQDKNGNLEVTYNYLSASPWPLAPSYINGLIRQYDFPWGSFTAKPRFPAQRCATEYQEYSDDYECDDITDDDDKLSCKLLVARKLSRFGSRVGNALARKKEPSVTREVERSSSSSRSVAEKFSHAYEYKLKQFSKLVAGPAWKRIAVFGDSSEADPEIFAELVSRYSWYSSETGEEQGKIQCVFIRFAPPKDEDETEEKFQELEQRVATIFSPLGTNWKDRVRVFKTGGQLNNVDMASGRC